MKFLNLLFTVSVAWVVLLGGVGEIRAESKDWSGTWETQWRNGAAVLYLSQEGNQLSGTYPLLGGEMEGSVENRQVRGTWRQRDGKSGGFVFTLSEDGLSFTGRFESGEWWTGRRISPQKEPKEVEAYFSSPREVLKTFLLSAGASVEGDVSQLQTAASCLRLPEHDADSEESLPGPLESVHLMFELLDLTTLRLWEIPGRDWADENQVDAWETTLAQAGTGETVELTFKRDAEGWHLIVPAEDALKNALDRLRRARSEQEEIPPEAEALSSPRDTLRTFLETVGSDFPAHRKMLMQTMDLSHLGPDPQPKDALLLSEYLKRVIDRVGFVIFQEIPDDPWGEEPYVHFHHPVGDVVLAQTDESEDGTPQWRFTSETMQSIREAYLAVEDMPVVGFVQPAPVRPWRYFWMREGLRSHAPWLLWRIGGVELWQWAVLLGSGVIFWLLSIFVSAFVVFFGRRSQLLGKVLAPRQRSKKITRTLRLALAAFFLNLILGSVGLPEHLSALLARLALSVGVVAMLWLVIQLLNMASRLNAKNLESPLRNHRGVLISLSLGLINITAFLAAILLLADIWAVPYTSMLAGLGVGGVAVALATKNTLENVIAGFTLFLDRPLSVGDFCKYGTSVGSVERIGLRSVRIRSLERSVVSLPTSVFADMPLENLAVRDRFLMQFSLGLRYETTGDQLRYVLAEIRKMLLGHPNILEDPARVRFDGFGDYSLKVEIFAYVAATDWNEYLAVREDVGFRLMQIVEDAGTGFAFPSQTTYLARDSGTDSEKTEKAERQVDQWRQSNQLPIPDFSDEDLAQMKGRLDFPPKGSVRRPPPEA